MRTKRPVTELPSRPDLTGRFRQALLIRHRSACWDRSARKSCTT